MSFHFTSKYFNMCPLRTSTLACTAIILRDHKNVVTQYHLVYSRYSNFSSWLNWMWMSNMEYYLYHHLAVRSLFFHLEHSPHFLFFYGINLFKFREKFITLSTLTPSPTHPYSKSIKKEKFNADTMILFNLQSTLKVHGTFPIMSFVPPSSSSTWIMNLVIIFILL